MTTARPISVLDMLPPSAMRSAYVRSARNAVANGADVYGVLASLIDSLVIENARLTDRCHRLLELTPTPPLLVRIPDDAGRQDTDAKSIAGRMSEEEDRRRREDFRDWFEAGLLPRHSKTRAMLEAERRAAEAGAYVYRVTLCPGRLQVIGGRPSWVRLPGDPPAVRIEQVSGPSGCSEGGEVAGGEAAASGFSDRNDE